MSYKRFFKKCEEFSLCGVTSDAGDIDIDGALNNYTIYHIIVKGSGRLGTPFSSEYVEGDTKTNNFYNEKHLLGVDRIFEAYTDTLMFGFNPLKPDQDWDGKLIEESFVGDSDSYLVCFDGNPVVNGVEMQRMDYAKLTDKKYEVELKNGLLGMFTKKFGFKLT